MLKPIYRCDCIPYESSISAIEKTNKPYSKSYSNKKTVPKVRNFWNSMRACLNMSIVVWSRDA